MKTIEINCETGETFERDMTVEEGAAYALVTAEAAALQAEQEAAIAAKAAAKESALAKFQALGLTEEEALALLG
jgi:hypothetical protein